MASEREENTTMGEKGVSADAETYAAIMASDKPNPLGPGYIKMYMLTVVIFLCSTMSGFDSSLMSSINALPNYTEYFGLPSSGSAATGIVFAIYQIGQIAAAFFVFPMDWYGRIWHIFLGSLGVILGTIITATATTLPTFIGGRFLLSFFATFTITAAPLYLVEIAPAAYRGTIAGLYNTFYYVGSILATFAVYACHLYLSSRGNDDWKIPLWIQAVCPGIVVVFIKFFPESPRYLILNDRHEEARAFIVKYHTNGDPDHPLVELQMKEMIENVQGISRGSWKDLFDLHVLVESRSSRYRLMLNVIWSWFAQFSGNNIISYYLPTMLAAVGITSTNTKLELNIVYAVVGWVFSTFGARLHDVVGRRKMLMWSTAGMTICLALVAGGSVGKIEFNNTSAATVSIVFIFVFGAIFSAGYTPMQPVYPAEVVSNAMRAKAMGTYKITAGAAGFLNTFVGPIALANIGYCFYVFFVFWDSLELVFMYFFFVETKGLTLEELDAVFEADNPRKASLQAKKMQKMYKAAGNAQQQSA
ncbi:general substrate transporter [Xylariaceae sp. FL0255]|nr:general substrate transporter [Xylariaceae sp. FL0255]